LEAFYSQKDNRHAAQNTDATNKLHNTVQKMKTI